MDVITFIDDIIITGEACLQSMKQEWPYVVWDIPRSQIDCFSGVMK